MAPIASVKFTLSIILIIVSESCNFTINKNNNDLIIDEAIVKHGIIIANKKFDPRRQTLVIDNKVDGNLVNEFLNCYNGTVVINNNEIDPLPKQIVLFTETFESFTQTINAMKPNLKGKILFNSSAKILILLTKNASHIELITGVLWNHHATNAILITRYKTNCVALYTYFPYRRNSKCQDSSPVLLNILNEDSSKMNTSTMYPDKMKRLYGCPLYISTNKLFHPSTELKAPLEIIKRTVIRLLRDVMDFTPIFFTKEYVSIDSDRARNWSESLNDVLSGVANVSTCTIPLGVDRIDLLDFTMPYYRVSLAWLAPPVTAGPVWWRLLSPLNDYLWLVLLIVVSFVTALPFILKMYPLKIFSYKYLKNLDKVRGAAFRIVGVLLGQPIRVAPKRFRDFYVMSLWLWFTFVVRSAYQSVLIGALKTETVRGQFISLQDAIEVGYKFGGREGILVHFEHEPMINVGFQTISENEFEKTFDDVVHGRKKFVLATSLEYAWRYCAAESRNENECVYVIPDSILTLPLVVWLQKYSPFARSLAKWIPRLFECGLLEREVVKSSKHVVSKPSDPIPLVLDQIFGCILCLVLGYSLCFIVFIIEIIMHKHYREI